MTTVHKETQDDAIWDELDNFKNTAPQELLDAGIPISYREDDTPEGHIIRQYPDGRRELVHIAFDKAGTHETVVRPLEPVDAGTPPDHRA